MAFSDEVINYVWTKGKIVPGYNQNIYRQDIFGSWMKAEDYGNRNSKYGWEIDHINPNGTDNPSNLQPLQWENNVRKSDQKMKWSVQG